MRTSAIIRDKQELISKLSVLLVLLIRFPVFFVKLIHQPHFSED